MDIPRPENFNETYLYEGNLDALFQATLRLQANLPQS